MTDTLVGWVLELSGVEPLLATPRGVEVTEGWQGSQRLLFLLNHTEGAQEVSLNGCYADLLTGNTFEGSVIIAPRDVLVLQER